MRKDDKLARLVEAALGSPVNRRSFLKTSALLGGSAVLATTIGCSDDDHPAADAGVDGPLADGAADQGADAQTATKLFDVLEEVQQALRQSPDHLTARANALVAAKDASAIHTFVRDEIVTIPSEDFRMDRPDIAVRWGWRGTLRGGAGTPREKADLLAELYRRAGFTPQVVAGYVDAPPSDWKPWLLRTVEREFKPPIDDAKLAGWRQSLGLPTTSQTKIDEIDADQSAAKALAQSLTPLLGAASWSVWAFDWRNGFQRIPEVKIEVDGKTQYANPTVPKAVFGTSYLKANEQDRPADPARELLKVKLRLEAAASDAPADRIKLLETSFGADQLVGRQVVLSMLPTMPIEAWATTAIGGVRLFTPTLTVQGADLSDAEAQQLSVQGDSITVNGDRVEERTDGSIWLGDAALVVPGAPPVDAKQIDKLVIEEISAAEFDEVVVKARATDTAGKAIEGLPASAFELAEEGEAKNFLLRTNANRPRVSILSDQSLSMPVEFRGAAAQVFLDQLEAQIAKVEPNASFGLTLTNSNLWTEAAKAAAKQPSVVVFCTDGDVGDKKTPQIEAQLKQGPPVVLLAVAGTSKPVLDEIAQLSGGVVFPVTKVSDAVSAVAGYLATYDPPPYTLTYSAPKAGPATRQVSLRRAEPAGTTTKVEAKGSYQVPSAPAQARRLCGLYLYVSVKNENNKGVELTRTLAGNLYQTKAPVDEQAIKSTRDALLGSTFVSFEAHPPTRAQWLDDVISTKLTLRDFYDPDKTKTAGDALALFGAGIRYLPTELFSVYPPMERLGDATALPYVDRLCGAIYSEQPQIGTSVVLKRIDVLPTSRFCMVMEGDGAARRDRTAEALAQLAISEQTLFDKSTASLLANAKLATVRWGDHGYFNQSATLTPDEKARWKAIFEAYRGDVRLVPESGAPLAYWSLDHESGALLGILPDGTGGGTTAADIQRQIAEIDRLASALNLLATAAGGGVALGLVVNWGQLLARLYGAVAVTIATLDASGLDAAVRSAISNFACNAIKTLFLGAMGGPGTAWGSIESVLGLLTDVSTFTCPG